MRLQRALTFILYFALPFGCGGDVEGVGLAIHDPLALIDEVDGPLRLFVLPASSHTCDTTTGAVSPEVPDLPQGMVAAAVADISLPIDMSAARGEVQVGAGEYVVLVRGKGTDPVSGIPNVFIATGCTAATIGAGETLEVRITLIPIVGMGECGDGTFSPDEQCEDSNVSPGDGCSATCRTEVSQVSTTAASGIRHPSVGGAAGQRWIVSFDAANTDTRLRLFEPDGATIAVPSVLMMDTTLRDALPTALIGVHLFSDSAVSSTGRIGISFGQLGAPTRVRAAFFDRDRNPEGDSVIVRDGLAVTPSPTSSAAFAGNGAFMTAFTDMTNVSAQIFPSMSTTPIAPDPFAIGTGATEPAIAGGADHFAVAFSSGGGVHVQRFATDGTPRDAAPVMVDAAGSDPAIAVLPDGRVLVAWTNGSTIHARGFASDGSPAGAAVDVGSGTAPTVAASGNAFLVAYEAGGTIRARVLAPDATPIPNREQPPTTADFEVAPSGTEPDAMAGGPSATPLVFVSWSQSTTIQRRLFTVP